MISFLNGKLEMKTKQYVVLNVNGLGFKVFISSRTSRKLPKTGTRAKLFSHLCLTQAGMEIYGFLDEQERGIFEMLDSINGVGPKAALKIIGEMKAESLLAAIGNKRGDLLTKAAGIGDKKASRIILELSDKIKKQKLEQEAELMESNLDLEEILKSLGYKRSEAREAIKKIPLKTKTLQEKLKIAFKILNPAHESPKKSSRKRK